MRVAIVNLHRGGMMHYAAGLARSLLAADPRTVVSLHGPRDAETAVFDPRVEVFRYPIPQALRAASLPALLGVPVQARVLLKRLRELKPDLVHVNSGHIANPFFLPDLARHIPVVASIHDIQTHPGERRPVEWLKVPPLLRAARVVLVHGRSLREAALRRWRLPAGRVVAFPLVMGALPVGAAGVAMPQPGALLMFGRLLRYKGYEALGDALALAAPQAPALRVIIAGPGALSPVRALLERHGDRVEVRCGYVADAAVAPLFRAASVVLLPYTEASQSGIVQLAAAFARPVIVTRTGAIPEVVDDGRTGLLVPPGDARALASAMLALAGDPVRCAAMGAAAYEALASPARYAEYGRRLLDVYTGVLSGTPG